MRNNCQQLYFYYLNKLSSKTLFHYYLQISVLKHVHTFLEQAGNKKKLIFSLICSFIIQKYFIRVMGKGEVCIRNVQLNYSLL